MRAPQPALFYKYARYIVFFILGMVTGAVIFVYIHGQTMDRLLLENRHLVSVNNALQDEVEALQEDKQELNEQTQQTLIVQKVEIDIEENRDEIDEFTETEIADLLREETKFLINKPLESIAETSDTLYKFINDKTYTIDQQEIGVRAEAIVIYTTLTLKISLHKVS